MLAWPTLKCKQLPNFLNYFNSTSHSYHLKAKYICNYSTLTIYKNKLLILEVEIVLAWFQIIQESDAIISLKKLKFAWTATRLTL
jgi:hypothetical protein